MEPALASADGPEPEAGPRRLWSRDVAALVSAATGQTVKSESITQYVWQRHRHIRDEGQARPGDIPEPAGRGRPPWRVSGALYPYWEDPGPVAGWAAGRQVAGRPRTDGQPRVRGGDDAPRHTHLPRVPHQPPGASTVRCGSLGANTPLAADGADPTCATCTKLHEWDQARAAAR